MIFFKYNYVIMAPKNYDRLKKLLPDDDTDKGMHVYDLSSKCSIPASEVLKM